MLLILRKELRSSWSLALSLWLSLAICVIVFAVLYALLKVSPGFQGPAIRSQDSISIYLGIPLSVAVLIFVGLMVLLSAESYPWRITGGIIAGGLIIIAATSGLILVIRQEQVPQVLTFLVLFPMGYFVGLLIPPQELLHLWRLLFRTRP